MAALAVALIAIGVVACAVLANPALVEALSSRLLGNQTSYSNVLQGVVLSPAADVDIVEVTVQNGSEEYVRLPASTIVHPRAEELVCGEVVSGGLGDVKQADGVAEVLMEEGKRDGTMYHYTLGKVFSFRLPEEVLLDPGDVYIRLRYAVSGENDDDWYVMLWDFSTRSWSSAGLNASRFKPDSTDAFYEVTFRLDREYLGNYLSPGGELLVRVSDRYLVSGDVDEGLSYLLVDYLALEAEYHVKRKLIHIVVTLTNNADVHLVGNLTVYASFTELVYDPALGQFRYAEPVSYVVAEIEVELKPREVRSLVVPYVLERDGIYTFRAEYAYSLKLPG